MEPRAQKPDSISEKPGVAIVGAGPAGLAAAWEFSCLGFPVEIFEAGPRVGGLAASFELWGHRVDFGPHHFVCDDPETRRFWHSFAGNDIQWIRRNTSIVYRGKRVRYPLALPNALLPLGLPGALLSFLSYLRQRWQFPALLRNSFGFHPYVKNIKGPDRFARRESRDMEEWLISRFGRRLYRIFFREYSEKLWGRPCAHLTVDFARQRIRRMSLGQAVLAAVWPGYRQRHRSLNPVFPHPQKGAGSVYENLARALVKRGVVIRLNQPVERIETGPGRKVRGVLCRGERKIRPFSRVVSTMPLPHLLRGLPDVPRKVRCAAERLHFRHTIFVYLWLPREENLFAEQWLYIQSGGLRLGRVTNYKNWGDNLNRDAPGTILGAEFWTGPEEEFWRESDHKLMNLARQEMVAAQILPPGAVVAAGEVIRKKNIYPVYAHGYREELDRVEDWLGGLEGLRAVGRYGSFHYNNQDHSLAMGRQASRQLAAGLTGPLSGTGEGLDGKRAAVRPQMEPGEVASGESGAEFFPVT